MKIAIFGKVFSEKFCSAIKELFAELSKTKVELYLYRPFFEFISKIPNLSPAVAGLFSNHEDINKTVDLMIVIGGDGTFLESVAIIRNSGIPLVGINSGRLGFLANISEGNISTTIRDILNGYYTFEQRTLIELDTPNLFGDFNIGLNELTIHKKDSSSMITIHTYLDDDYLNSYWADGLIIATPTGSTAYSLSAGGPIVVPNSQNFIIAPIAPHNLTVRPIVVPDNRTIRLKVEGRSPEFLASLDYRSVSFKPETELVVRKANYKINMLKFGTQTFFSTLRNKLMWGADRRN